MASEAPPILLLGWRDPTPELLLDLCCRRELNAVYTTRLSSHSLIVVGDAAIDTAEGLPAIEILRRLSTTICLSPRTACPERIMLWGLSGVGLVVCRSRLCRVALQVAETAELRPAAPSEWVRPRCFARAGPRGLLVLRTVPLLHDYSVEDLARRLEMSRYALKRLCLDDLGVPPSEILWWHQQTHVLVLRARGVSKAQTAVLSRFANASSMERAFTRRGLVLP